MDLVRVFTEWNLKAFNGELVVPELRYNPRLKTTAGRFIPHRTRPVIEVASYLLEQDDPAYLIVNTLGHEMIHYWLWHHKMPYGHTVEFYKKMEEIDVPRYNPVPLHRPFKYTYQCDHCGQSVKTRKRLPLAACATCCNEYANGKFSSKFELRIVESSDKVIVKRGLA